MSLPYDYLPPEPALKQIQLEGIRYPGFTVGFRGWTGNAFVPITWMREPYRGCHVKGVPGKTVIRSETSEASLIFSRRCGYVKLEDIIIKSGRGAGKQKAIFGGVDAANATNFIPYTLHLKNCVIEADVTVDPDGHPEWLIFLNQGDLILENCLLRSRNTNEHALYMHGFGSEGCYIVNCELDGVGAEGFKFTARPQARYYQDPGLLAQAGNAYTDGYHPISQDKWIVVRGTTVRDWHQPWSWRGGAGMTVQGAGINVLVEDSSFVDFGETKPAIAFDDSGVEHFGQGNVGGTSPANGDCILRRCTFASGPGPSWYTNVLRFGTLIPGSPIQVARSILIEDCGVYGDHMMAAIGNIAPNNVIVRRCNTPEANARAAALGVNTSFEAALSIGGFFGPISQGWRD